LLTSTSVFQSASVAGLTQQLFQPCGKPRTLAVIQKDSMKSIFTFLSLLTLVSCHQTETKKVIEKFDNGKDGIVLYYKDSSDTLNYRKEAFYKSGEKYYVGQVTNGKKDGIWIWWYTNGNKKDQCKYLVGFYVDTVFHWCDNGQLKQIEIVKAQNVGQDDCCNCNGKIIRYYENGKIKEQFTNLGNLTQDTSKSWFDNGQLEYYAYFKNGKEEGNSEWFYSNGAKKTKGQYIKGLLEGDVFHWDSLGKVTAVETYKNGQIIHER
jgi:uncharacterized protein